MIIIAIEALMRMLKKVMIYNNQKQSAKRVAIERMKKAPTIRLQYIPPSSKEGKRKCKKRALSKREMRIIIETFLCSLMRLFAPLYLVCYLSC